MKNKTIGIFVIGLLIANVFPVYITQANIQEQKKDITKLSEIKNAPSSLPSQWDWRNVDGKNWITPVKDLLGQPFCFAFSFCSVLEACFQIKEGNPRNCDLSEAHVICYAGGPGIPLVFPDLFAGKVQSTGVVDEDCFPYSTTINCNDLCDNWEEHTTKIIGSRKIQGPSSEETRSRIKKYLIKYGPVQSCMDQYEDFQTYTGGIYEHKSGNLVGGHGVAIIGYNDDPGYWIGKDQKGTAWGEQGFFRIKYGECKIESQYVWYWQLQENPVPEKPDTPTGTAKGKPGEEYTYSTSSTDIENDDLYYQWNWGDGNTSKWLGPYASGETCEVSYNWSVKGTYNVTVKAKDDFYGESVWSDPLSVSMPLSYDKLIPRFLELLFQRFTNALSPLQQLMG